MSPANASSPFVERVLDRLVCANGPLRPRRLENPVTCCIGTILAQATNDRLAERAYRALRERFPTWTRVMTAPRAEVEEAIRCCGLARQKARAIQSFLEHLERTRGRLALGDLRRPGLDVDRALADLCRAQCPRCGACPLADLCPCAEPPG